MQEVRNRFSFASIFFFSSRLFPFSFCPDHIHRIHDLYLTFDTRTEYRLLCCEYPLSMSCERIDVIRRRFDRHTFVAECCDWHKRKTTLSIFLPIANSVAVAYYFVMKLRIFRRMSISIMWMNFVDFSFSLLYFNISMIPNKSFSISFFFNIQWNLKKYKWNLRASIFHFRNGLRIIIGLTVLITIKIQI